MPTCVNESRADRLAEALQASGLSVSNAARLLGCSTAILRKVIASEEFEPLTTFDVVRLAAILRVDPRWLYRGIPAPAAEAAIENLRRLRRTKQGNFDRMKQADFNDLLEVMRRWRQPELAEAEMMTCRYCGCTPLTPCAEGCAWVDRECTICSACLEPGEGA